MSRPEILVLKPLLPDAMAALEAEYILHRHDRADAPDDLLREVGSRCRAIVTDGHTPLDAPMLDHLPALEIVGCGSAGYEGIDAEALRARGVRFTTASLALVDDVADIALLLVLATGRDLVRAHAYVADGAWGRDGMYPLQHALRGKRAGILGMGPIGQAIARRCAVIGLEVGYLARTEKPGLPYRFDPDILSLAAWSDILVIALPGGRETAGLVSTPVLEALGAGGTLVNIGRGSVVDEPALIDALRSGTIASAGLDVFASEPDPDTRLTALPNVTLYPHHASGTVETRAAMSQLVVDNLAAHFAGGELVGAVF